MNLELEGKVALIAGGSRGIGLSIAHSLHAENCTVALCARDRPDLDRAAETFRDRVSVHQADVSNPLAARALAETIVERWSRLDVLICNAGSGASVPPGHEDDAEWRRVFDMNLFTASNMIAAARPYLRRQGGAIICISSICGLAALGAPVTYSAAKAALNAMVRGLARPLAKEHIRINAVAPGNILFDGGSWAKKKTENSAAVEEMVAREVALARMGTPEEIANLTTFLASSRASFVTGTIVVVDGGQLRA